MQNAVFCSVPADDLRGALIALRASGIAEREVSVLCSDVPAVAGAYSGPTEGRLPNATSLIVTGIGPCIVSGPIAQMLAGTPAGYLVSGLTAAPADLVRLIGVSQQDHPLFEGRLRGGEAVVLVHYKSARDESRARRVFGKVGSSDIRVTGPLRAVRAARPGGRSRA